MIGISAFGVYLPAYRLSREVIAQATGGGSGSGERTVANYDEDALTMGVEASLGCADNYAQAWGAPLDAGTVRALIFASASSPYREKQAANVIGTVLEANRSGLMTDLTGSLRGGVTGIEVARQLLKEAGAGAKALVVASDRRPAELRSGEEQAFGDGAAALLLGQDNLIATLDAHVAVNANFIHTWRRENDEGVHSGDTRFVENYGYLPLMGEAVRGLLKETGLKSENVAKLVAYGPNARLAQQLAKRAGFNPETQLADTLYRNVGDTGTAQVFLSLIGALSRAKAGERLLVAGYGDGAEAILLTVTDSIQKTAACRGIDAYLKRRRPMTTYGKYLQFRDVIGESSYDAFSSLPLLWREEKQNLKLYAAKCKNCGVIHFPRRRVCDKCGTKDKMEDFKLGRRGRVYTYTNDHVYLNPDPPETLAVVDLEGGGRFFGQAVDISPQDMKIGLEMELSFRKLHDGQDVANYFWKARPAIGGK